MENTNSNIKNKYFHYSTEPFTLKFKKYIQNEDSAKPEGLWFSKNTEWIDWCESEELFLSKDSAIVNELSIDFTNILVIDSIEKLKWLSSKFCLDNIIFHGINIDWCKVASQYDGVYFDNYYSIQEQLRAENLFHEYLWYFTVDINSGCIFTTDKIIKINQVNN